MDQNTQDSHIQPEAASHLSFKQEFQDASPLDAFLRDAARRMLQQAIEEEVQEFLGHHDHKRDEQGRRLVVRNGYLPEREFLAPAGPLKLRQPRVRDLSKDPEEKVTFSPTLLPRYLRRTKAVDDMIPWLYLNGVSTNDFPSALQAVFGETAKTLSPNTIVRLKEQWTQEYEQWCKRDLSDRHYVYFWVDGIHVKVRLGDEADRNQCILVIIGATADGRKELVAVADGYRESEASWTDVLVDLKRRGLNIQPKLAIGDGALGFWAAIRKTMPQTAEQRCWVHKTANILNKLPKSLQSKAKSDLHEIWMSPTSKQANKVFDEFLEDYGVKYPKVGESLRQDREELMAFYQFPAEHWEHIRSTNPIESTFATIRLRHRQTKGSGSRRTSLAMLFKLGEKASKGWKRLKGYEKLAFVVKGCHFKDGLLEQNVA